MVALSAQAASVTIQFIEISIQITTILQWGVTVCQLLLQFNIIIDNIKLWADLPQTEQLNYKCPSFEARCMC